MAGRTLQRVRAVFAYAIASGRSRHNPAAEIKGALAPTPKKKHFAALPIEAMPEFLHKLMDYQDRAMASPLVMAATRLLALTFVRTGEVRGAQWGEFDLKKKLWTIPAERMKSCEPHIVPLSSQAIEILKALHPLTGHGEILFPNRNDGGKPISENTVNKVIEIIGYKGRMTGHGFRTVASTCQVPAGYKRAS